MIYLDYAANTPVDKRVLEEYCKTNLLYFGNPNANHQAGFSALNQIEKASEQLRGILHCGPMEVLYTSGASEANNLAIKGAARAYRENGRHIISTCLEHSSVSGALTWLQQTGCEIDLVDIKKDGTVDLQHLKELLRKDTVLVSIGYVDSELGVCQPIREIGEIVRDYPQCIFHTDATQAVGKIKVDTENIDLMTFTPHKFFGLNGMGVLLRKENVVLEPLVHGGKSSSIYRSGTPVPAWAVSIAEALKISYNDLDNNFEKVRRIRHDLQTALQKYPLVHINSTEKSLPHFLNVSVKEIKAEVFQSMLNEKGIYVSTKSACSVPNTPSRAVYAVTGDRKLARCSWRISVSHLTGEDEVKEFLAVFDRCYHELTDK